MKIAFAGTPEFAATILRGLISSPHTVGLVISQPDPRAGRGRKMRTTPVAELARSTDLPLLQPARISESAEEISRHDALVVGAYGQILHPDTLYAATHGAWNVHASLLPRYRGAAPVERAIMAGDRETGVSIMRMDEGLDTGPVALQRSVPIPPDMTGGELTSRLAKLGSEALVEVLGWIEAGTLTLTEQDRHNATYATKLSDEDQIIRWARRSREIHDQVRALAPRIGARTYHERVDGPVKIWRSRIVEGVGEDLRIGGVCSQNSRMFVGCGEGVLEVLELQVPGARRVSVRDFLLGNTLDGGFSS